MQVEQVVHRDNEDAHAFSCVDHDREIRDAAKRSASALHFIEVNSRYAQILVFLPESTAAALDRNAHDFLIVGIASDKVDASVVHARTLESVLGEPIQHQVFTKITSDF